jgi:hypothetical protein
MVYLWGQDDMGGFIFRILLISQSVNKFIALFTRLVQ